MIDLLFVALFQAAAGEPQTPSNASGTPPAQQSAPASEQGAQPSQTEEKERMRCRRQTIVGSRLGRVVCVTDKERERINDESRDLVNRAQGSQAGASGQ